MRRDELVGMGHQVESIDSLDGWWSISWARRWWMRKAGSGEPIDRLNRRVVERAEQFRPDLLWGEKQEYLTRATLHRLRELGVASLHFTPDPYFTLAWKRTAEMDACLPLWDYFICCKAYEVEDYRNINPKTVYMPLGFAEAVHRPGEPEDDAQRERFRSDLCFIGGWEPRREQYLDAAAKLGGKLKIWGYSWDHVLDGRWTFRRYMRLKMNAGRQPFSIAKRPLLAAAFQGGEVYGDEYAFAVSGARINVGFLRKICPDQHTTRTFEIPACGSMLLADRTDEHREFFKEGEEAEFFGDQGEMLEKLDFYLRNEDRRRQIAENGQQRCHKSGYSYRARLHKAMCELGLVKEDLSTVAPT